MISEIDSDSMSLSVLRAHIVAVHSIIYREIDTNAARANMAKLVSAFQMLWSK